MLQIIFKDGETRNLNVHPLFFVIDKTSRETIVDKCYAIAHDFGNFIFKMTLFEGIGEMVIKENAAFNPAELVELRVVPTKDEKKEKRRLRNLFKHQVFTMKINLNTGMNTNLETGESFFSTGLLAA